ncbi:hypothetical protein DOTSEDRAFT_28291 [Dothistroma septosporum NZE10]|uniref:Uncharacterized protein n=1 Tax=Dothistroma septosporum (strain NZE10 / CBS 128990) TaxID=675120 RepID=M2WJG0_DOTSN|nr:hypothetical protein DOTSEDRAFT_28291 [Dothistroma septosporum NZE10]
MKRDYGELRSYYEAENLQGRPLSPFEVKKDELRKGKPKKAAAPKTPEKPAEDNSRTETGEPEASKLQEDDAMSTDAQGSKAPMARKLKVDDEDACLKMIGAKSWDQIFHQLQLTELKPKKTKKVKNSLNLQAEKKLPLARGRALYTFLMQQANGNEEALSAEGWGIISPRGADKDEEDEEEANEEEAKKKRDGKQP